MDIPARPDKSSNPWYEAREAYDEAIENVLDTTYKVRGKIPDGSDLNDFSGPDYRGIWWFTNSNEMENPPVDSTASGVLEIITGGDTGNLTTKQVYSTQHASYWREAIRLNTGEWGDWYKYVSDQDLNQGRGEIPEGTDMNDMHTRDWMGTWYVGRDSQVYNLPKEPEQNTVVEVVSGGVGSATVQRVTDHVDSFVREASWLYADTGQQWGDWRKEADLYELPKLFDTTPSEKIKALAERDGWYCVYDPSDPSTVELTEDGRILRIRDGLGNAQPMSSETKGHHPKIIRNEFGQLNGFTDGLLQNNLGDTLSTFTMIVLFKGYDSRPTEEIQTIVGTRFEPPSLIQISIRDRNDDGPEVLVNHGYNSSDLVQYNTSYRLYRGTRDIDGGGRITLDGEFKATTRGGNTLSGLSLGSKSDYSDRFDGSIGLVMLYDGEIDESKVQSMEALISSLTGINTNRRPQIDSRAVVYTVDEHGREAFVHGDPDRIDEVAGVASITKLMTLWLARKYFSDSDMDQMVEIHEDDVRSNRFEAGDQVSLRDLFYASGMRSDNTAPNSVARACGALIDPTGDHRASFISAMNDEAEDLGYVGSHFPNPQHSANMSARQVVDLFKRALGDPILREAFKMGDQEITVTRPSGSTHTLTMTSTVTLSDPFDTKEIFAAKTGTNYGFGHVVFGWTGHDGIDYVTATLSSKSSPSSSRYVDLNKAIVKTPQ